MHTTDASLVPDADVDGHTKIHTQWTHANFGNRYQIAVLMQEK